MDEQDMREAGVILISSEVKGIPRPHIDLKTASHPLTTINKSKQQLSIYKPKVSRSGLLRRHILNTKMTFGGVGLGFLAIASAAGISYTTVKKKHNKAKLSLLNH